MDTSVNVANQVVSVGADIAFDADPKFFACLVRFESSSVPTTLPTAYFFFSSRRRHTSFKCDWSSDVCSSDLHLVIDCHTTNGSIHRFAMTFDIPHVPDSGRREPIDYMRRRLLPAVQAAVKAHDGLDSFWYGNFLRDEGGEGMGWITYPHHPRFGGNYRGLTNRLDLLLETYAYLSFPERVPTTYAFLRESLRHVASHGDEILGLLAGCVAPPDEVSVDHPLQA